MARKRKGWFEHTWDWLLDIGLFHAALVLNLSNAVVLAITMWVLKWYVQSH